MQVKEKPQNGANGFLTYIWLYLSVTVDDLSVSEDIGSMGSLKHRSACRWWRVFSFYDIESTGTSNAAKTELAQAKFCGGPSALSKR